MRNLLALWLIIVSPAFLIPQINSAPQSLVLTHVTVIDMTGAPPKPNMTVVIASNRITLLGRDTEVSAPPNARVIDASGKFLIPGLWDMHAHTVYDRADDTERTLLPLFVINGVSGIRNLGSINSIEQINRWRAQVSDGRLIAPRIVIGQQVDGFGGDKVSFVYRVRSAAEARAAVERIKREGFDFVKVYSRLSREEYFAATDEAKRLGLPFAGHVPLAVGVGDASDAGQKSIEHLEGMLVTTSSDEARIRIEWMEYEQRVKALNGQPQPPALEAQNFRLIAESLDTFNEEKAARLYSLFARNGTYHCPTLVIHRAWGSLAHPALFTDARLRYVPVKQRSSVNSYLDAVRSWPAERKAIVERLFQSRLRMVREMQRAGVELLAGTDTAYGYPVGGFALHDELSLFVQAGLTPMEALRTATYNPAKYLGLLDALGTVEKGKVAHLVLLEANPLDDISNTQRINAVIMNGRYLPKEELQRMLANIEAAANRR